MIMKRFITLIIMVLLVIPAAIAKDRKKLYSEYSGRPGVSAVYISPAMFKLIRSIPDVQINDQDVNLSSIISSLEGMYILSTDSRDISYQLRRDVEKELTSGRYEMLMEAVEGKETTRIFMLNDGNRISDLILLSKDGDSTSFISITGQMSMDEVSKMIK